MTTAEPAALDDAPPAPPPGRALRIDTDRAGVLRAGRARKLAWLSFGFFGGLAFMGPWLSGQPPCLTVPAAIVSAWAVLRLHFQQPISKPDAMRAGTIEIDPDAITLDLGARRVTFPRAEIEDGWIEPRAFGGVVLRTVMLRLANGDVLAFWARDEDEAQAALRAAGVLSSQRVLRMRLASAARQRPLGVLAGWGALFALVFLGAPAVASLFGGSLAAVLEDDATAIAGMLMSLPLALVLGYATLRVVRYLAPPWVVVGTDGVAIRRAGLLRFVPFAQVADVAWDARGVWLRLHRGERVLLATPAGSPTGDALHARVVEAMGSVPRAPAPPAKLELLDRRGRTFEAWKQDLRDLAQGAGYRHVVMERDELVAVLEDPRSAPERRVAAALALAPSADPDARDRLRVVIDTCAGERLRVAIGHAASDDLAEAELARALDEAAARAPRRRLGVLR